MIQFINVNKEYKNGVMGLQDINVRIQDGEFVFLIGSSGAGKSTFTKLMIREISPTSGSILINGKGIHRLKRREVPLFRRNMGFVFQNYRLLSDRTAFENVAFAMEAVGAGKDEVQQKVARALEQVGLADRAHHFPAELSGGEQQRVAIARAIVNNPRIIVADEPTGNLDVETAKEIMDILYAINAQGTTILMATHDRGIVEKSHHRILTLSHGKLVGDDNLPAGYYLGDSGISRHSDVESEEELGNRIAMGKSGEYIGKMIEKRDRDLQKIEREEPWQEVAKSAETAERKETVVKAERKAKLAAKTVGEALPSQDEPIVSEEIRTEEEVQPALQTVRAEAKGLARSGNYTSTESIDDLQRRVLEAFSKTRGEK